MSGPRFYLITNDAARVRLMLSCHEGNMPRSIAVIDNPFDYAAVPDGAQYRCFWFGSRAMVWQFWSFWDVRRRMGGVSGIAEEDWQRILDWVERNRVRPTLRLLYGITFDDEAGDDQASDDQARDSGEPASLPVTETERPATPVMAVPATIPEQTRWL